MRPRTALSRREQQRTERCNNGMGEETATSPSPHGSPTLNNAEDDSRRNAAGRRSGRRSPTRKTSRRRACIRTQPPAGCSEREAAPSEPSDDRRHPAGSASDGGGDAAQGNHSSPQRSSPALPHPPDHTTLRTEPGRSPPHGNRAPATRAPARAETGEPATRAAAPSPVRAHTSSSF